MKHENILYGYIRKEDKLVIPEEQKKAIREAYEKFLETPAVVERTENIGTVIYTRTSENEEANASLSRQVEDCISFATEHGMTVVELDNSKPSMQKLIENAQADGCDVIVIIKERK